MIEFRLLRLSDAHAYLDFYERNWEYLKPWSPAVTPGFHTLSYQKRRLQSYIGRHRSGEEYRFGAFAEGRLISTVSLVAIERAAFQNGRLGYSTDQQHAGKGLTTEHVLRVSRFAFEELHLHRLEANVMPRNVGSARVLQKCGFERVGHSPKMIEIAGVWEDHDMYARVGDR